IPNFAHGEYYLIGAYAAYFALVSFGWPPAVAILFAAVVGFVFGAVIEKLTFAPLRKRNTGDWVTNAFMIGAGIQLIIQNGAQYIFSANYFGVEKLWDGNVAVAGFNISYDRLLFGSHGNAGCLLAVLKRQKWHFILPWRKTKREPC
ncbi:MAG: ABC transporter permease subunit, partial [Faecalispora jeddahensis]